MKAKASQALYAYWNEVRKGRLAPRRFEIEPSRITPVLPETFILERLSSETYRFRLAGTRVCELLGGELRGANFLDGWSNEDAITVARQLQASGQQGGVLLLTFETVNFGQVSAAFECILLPLVHTRDYADRFVGALSRLPPAEMAALERATSRRLVSAEMIWPDGKPHAVMATANRQAPFLPHVRNARIVRSERRQFRVYEGGLGKPANDKI
ncbi:MAG: PAS domain-containing protein [Hyphomicrobiaceae bacterium]